MSKLWLKFSDENGDEKRLPVEEELFTVGRHSSNDLTVTDSRLSREHIRIERVDGEFFVSDPGSSNGTTINGDKLTGPVAVRNGDQLDLGGGLKITAEINAEIDNPASEPPATAAPDPPETSSSVYAPVAAAAPSSEGIPASFFVLAPLLGIVMLVIVGGFIFLFIRNSTPAIAESGDDGPDYSSSKGDDKGDDESDKADDDTSVKGKKSVTRGTNDASVNKDTTTKPAPTAGGDNVPAPADQGVTGKVEQNGSMFLRRIAQNEPNAFLTSDQAKRVSVKVEQIGRSSALADNINAARKNAAQIKTLAASKNLKPQFLAVAAITKLGSSRGDIMQAVTSVTEIYGKLATPIGNEFSDDALLMVAAYDQGEAGDTMSMRNMLQSLAAQKNLPAPTREIRSIWFLEKNGKITPTEFDRALYFLAVGTVTQNPKDFGVNAEALIL